MKVLVYSAKSFEIPFLNEQIKGTHQLTYLPQRLTAENARVAAGYDAISIFSADLCDAEVLNILHQCKVKFIALRSTGFDNVDLNVASQLDIKVARVPEYSPYAIAEHAIGLLLAANRKIPAAIKRAKRFNFTLKKLIGFDLHGKTIGVIGTGRIGKVIVRILHGMGCNVLGTDISPDKEFASKYQLDYLPLNDLLRRSDVVFLSVPLNDSTKKMIDTENLQLMKDSAYLVNVARGGVVDTLDVLEALDNDQLAFYATDVYERESGVFFYDLSEEGVKDPMLLELLSHPKVLLTPHQAFATREAVSRIAEITLENLNRWEANESAEFEL